MVESASREDSLKKGPKISQNSKLEFILKVALFFLLFFVFLNKLILVDRNHSRPEKKLLSNSVNVSGNVVKGKPFVPEAFSLRFDFASEESGAKIIAYSKSLTNLSKVLEHDPGTYMLAPCQTTDWFVLSLSESILIQHIAFLSYEFYASSYKNIRISGSDVYPTSKWLMLAELETEPLTNEIFDISPSTSPDKNDGWFKYLKVELLDYHKLEDNYYCSITKMKVYGITAAEYLETEIGDERGPYEPSQQSSVSKLEAAEDVKRSLELSKASSGYSSLRFQPGRVAFEKKASVKLFGKRTESPSPTFLYDIKNTIVNSLYKFLMGLALRPGPEAHNKKLVYRILKIGKHKKYCGTNLLFHFDCNRFITYLLLEKYSVYYSNILDYVQLPPKHRWFDRVLFDFVKERKHLVAGIINDVGIKEVPVLVCLEGFSLFPFYRCYFYFNLKSFSTLLFTQYSQGINFTSHLNDENRAGGRPGFSDKFYFYYADNTIVEKRCMSKFKSLVRDGGRLVARYDYKVLDDYISSITVVDQQLLVNLLPESSTSYPFDRDTASPKLEKELVKMGKNFYRVNFLTNITKYLDGRSRADTVKKGFSKKTMDFHRADNIVDHEAIVKKDPKTHRHVLLKLSERIKSLEYLTNKLSNKIYEMEKLLNLSINQQICTDNQDQSNYWFQGKLSDILSILNIKRYKVVSRDGLSRNDSLVYNRHYYKLIWRYNGYETGYVYVENSHSQSFVKNLCKLNKCVPYNLACRRLRALYNLSLYYGFLNKSKLIRCMLRFECKCIYTPHKPQAFGSDEEWLYMYDFNVYNRYISVWNSLIYFLKLKFMKYFNVYLLFALFVCSQIFWISKYNSHNKQIKRLLCVGKS